MNELLEREQLLEQLAALPPGRLVLLGGEAGVGKTALVRAFAAQRGGRVLLGACESLATPTPLGPFVDVAPEVEGSDARTAALALLDELRRPALLVLEDLHWADQATLDALRVLGRRIDATASLVVATFRDDEVEAGHPLRVVLGELASAPGVRRLAVPRLTLDAVRALAEPEVDADALYALTHGNAFYVTEILAAGGTVLPETVRDAVLARVAHLEPAARRLLDAVAAVPRRAELSLLEAVAAEELEHLGACLDSGVLVAGRDAVSFRHELARLAVADALPPQRRRALHAAILAALAGSADAARLAHHAQAAGDTAAVLVHARAAATCAAEAGAHREAAAHWDAALRAADGLSDAEVAAMLEQRGYECYLTGQIDAALAARRDALARYRRTGDRLREGDQLRWISRLSWFTGRNADADDAAVAAVRVLEPLPESRELAMAISNVAQLRMLADRCEDAIAWGERAIALAERLGDDETLAHALNNVGAAECRLDRGPRRLEQSLELALARGFEEHVARAYTNLAANAVLRIDRDARRWLDEGIAYAFDRDLDSWRFYMLGWRARQALHEARWDEAAADATTVLAQAVPPVTAISPLVVLGLVRARRGDPGWQEPLDRALELALPTGEAQRLAPVLAARLEAALLAGEPPELAGPEPAELGEPWGAGDLAVWRRRAGVRDGPATVAEPYALELAGDHAAAAAWWRGRGCPYEAAAALAWSDDEAAVRAAHAELLALGAARAAALAARRLRDAGATAVPRGPRPATRANPGQLTERELEVLRLVAEGLRNADVADRLVVSRRTVDHHVSAILRKLGVRSRGEASAAAARLGVLPRSVPAPPEMGNSADAAASPPA